MLKRSLPFLLLVMGAASCSGSPTQPVPKTLAPKSVNSPVKVEVAAKPAVSIEKPSVELAPLKLYSEEGYDAQSREKPENAKDICELTTRNIRTAIDDVLKQPAASGRALPRQTWSGKTVAAYQTLVEGRYALTHAEKTILNQSGFVVLGRTTRPSFAHAYHDVFQSQLPVYVTMDSLFHAIFQAHEALMVHVERDLLRPRVHQLLSGMRSALVKNNAQWPRETQRDVDIYLSVAASLLSEKPIAGVLDDVSNDVASILGNIEKANGLFPVEIFGRSRMVDFSQYRPRGHYDTHPELIPYFKTMMWLMRLELNIVSRSSRSSAPGTTPDPRETPREAMMAIALSQLVDQSKLGNVLSEIEDVLKTLGGKREDVSVPDMLALHRRAGEGKLENPQTFESLRHAIGNDFIRHARIHYMPEGSLELPVIFTMMGPRITRDTEIHRFLVHSDTPGRYDMHVADMAFVLGHDRAREYLQSDLTRFPDFKRELTRGRLMMDDTFGEDLYTTWLLTIRALAKDPPKTAPTFMKSKPFQDLRINSTVAAYGQLRRNNVLIAGQGYEEGGCEIPDGYVEPAPEVLDGMIAFTERASALLTKLGDVLSSTDNRSGLLTLLPRMTPILKTLRRIVEREARGEALTEPERRFLSTIAEIVPATSGSPPLYTGWYFQLFDYRYTALKTPSFIADYHTSTNTGNVAYAGAGDPVLGVFVVDVGGAPRMMVGPVARAFEVHAPLTQRLTDDEGALVPNKESPWATSYFVEKTNPPTIRLIEDEERSSEKTKVFKVLAKEKIGSLKVEYLSHHGQPCGTGQANIGATRGEVTAKLIKLTGDDTCNGGYRLTVDGQVHSVEYPYFPTDIGIGDFWDLNLEPE